MTNVNPRQKWRGTLAQAEATSGMEGVIGYLTDVQDLVYFKSDKAGDFIRIAARSLFNLPSDLEGWEQSNIQDKLGIVSAINTALEVPLFDIVALKNIIESANFVVDSTVKHNHSDQWGNACTTYRVDVWKDGSTEIWATGLAGTLFDNGSYYIDRHGKFSSNGIQITLFSGNSGNNTTRTLARSIRDFDSFWVRVTQDQTTRIQGTFWGDIPLTDSGYTIGTTGSSNTHSMSFVIPSPTTFRSIRRGTTSNSMVIDLIIGRNPKIGFFFD